MMAMKSVIEASRPALGIAAMMRAILAGTRLARVCCMLVRRAADVVSVLSSRSRPVGPANYSSPLQP